MKTKPLFVGTVLALTLTSSAWAEHEGNVHDDADGPYHAHEMVFEGFGSASFGRETIDNISANRIKNDARLGAGIGMSYFFTKHVGVGGDAFVENTAHSFVDNVSASGIFRLPIGTTGLAPYIYGGGGHEFDLTRQWFAHFGGGLEYRFSSAIGIFTDARYVLVDKTANYGVVRLGFRTTF
ncbi:MAG TPA: hypothetical protein VGH19_12445 [Verrucomicrobiae bacterium]